MSGPEHAWFIFAFDHRNSFRGIVRGVMGRDDHATVVAAKSVLFDGFAAALAAGAPRSAAAILIDEEYGSGFAQPARALGARVVIPVERSGQVELSLEYGQDYLEHVTAMSPDGVKVLLRWDPDGDRAVNARQGALLAQVSADLAARAIPLMVEFLTPEGAPPDVRADAMVRTVEQILLAGAEPAIWKVEGLTTTAACMALGDAIGAGGRAASAIVLGRGVDLDTAVAWLAAAAPVPRFAGFAIGKTVWRAPLEAVLRGELDRAAGAEAIAARYRRLIDVWVTARRVAGLGTPPASPPR